MHVLLEGSQREDEGECRVQGQHRKDHQAQGICSEQKRSLTRPPKSGSVTGMTDHITPEQARQLANDLRTEWDGGPSMLMHESAVALDSLAAQLEAAQKDRDNWKAEAEDSWNEAAQAFRVIWAKANEQRELATHMFNERQLALAAIQDALGMLATGYPNRARDRLIGALPSRLSDTRRL